MADQDTLQSRLVHLDLKGAPLCLSYLEKVLPLFRTFGATGLLIEYEDTFPYQDDLKTIRAPHAYSEDNIKDILKLAEDNNLEVIPLVQTFGHLEFVLKHQQFAALREIKKYPMALCPSHHDSVTIVCKMIDQVIKLHPQVKHFHIGCDEVYHLGLCEACTQRMIKESLTKDQLFFEHVRNVAKHIKAHYDSITVIIWDDMLRYSEMSIILNCGLGDLVEPMVWHYLPKFILPSSLWDNLSAVFPNIWIASAFKGATGPKSVITNILYHLDNNNSWLDTVQLVKRKFKNIKGIAVTGWQRYDHYAILCELLPQGLPSLAICLKAIQQGTLGPSDLGQVAKELKFLTPIPFNPFISPEIPICEFPGSEIYQLTIEYVHTEAAYNELFALDGMTAWMHEYNVQRKFINPVHVEPLLGRAISILDSYHSLDKKIQATFRHVFVDGVEEEWRACFITPSIQRLEAFMEKARSLLYSDPETALCEEMNVE
ncbi:hexosaminidase D-like isoform X1 [Biomphalaria glabrata]|nr:hexosaminidase D-like isoform X1 [Biomphalaria glabrata]